MLHIIVWPSDGAELLNIRSKRSAVYGILIRSHAKKNELIQDESHYNEKDTLKYIYIFIIINHGFLSSALSVSARR